MTDINEEKIRVAVDSWKTFWDSDLEAVHLYGSTARGEWSRKSSDINLLLLLSSGHHYSRWQEAAVIAKRMNKKGFALPLMLTEKYLMSSLDVFPIEFLDMKLFHRTLHGDDILDTLEINPKDIRLQAEREIKGKWVQLRQAVLERGGNTSEMRNLLALSVPTWVSVFQALIYIQGDEVPAAKREVIKTGAEIAQLEPDVFLELERIRREKSPLNRNAAWKHLLNTLVQVDLLARFVDTRLIDK